MTTLLMVVTGVLAGPAAAALMSVPAALSAEGSALGQLERLGRTLGVDAGNLPQKAGRHAHKPKAIAVSLHDGEHGGHGGHGGGEGPQPGAPIEGKLWIDGREDGAMVPSAATSWDFGFQAGPTGNPITEFDELHGKPMHLIVVSQDLEQFAHIHPGLNQVTGLLQIRINEPSGDPDNQDAARVVTQSKKYFLFGEVKPKGQSQQEPRFTVVGGNGGFSPLKPDPTIRPGVIRKYFKSDGTHGVKGDAYQMTLKIDRMTGMLHAGANVQAWRDGIYQDVTDLEEWMGMPGHAIMISQAGDRVDDKVFRHLHAGGHGGGHGGHRRDAGQSGGAGPDLMFMLNGADIPPVGTYKLWVQSKRSGKVLTFPFVIELR